MKKTIDLSLFIYALTPMLAIEYFWHTIPFLSSLVYGINIVFTVVILISMVPILYILYKIVYTDKLDSKIKTISDSNNKHYHWINNIAIIVFSFLVYRYFFTVSYIILLFFSIILISFSKKAKIIMTANAAKNLLLEINKAYF